MVERPRARAAACLAVLAGLWSVAPAVPAQEVDEAPVQLACEAAPVVTLNAAEAVELRAWVGFGAGERARAWRAGRLEWHADDGVLQPRPGDAFRMQWLPGSSGARSSRANAAWRVEGVVRASCQVRVYRRSGADDAARVEQRLRNDRVSGRAVLLPHQGEPEGYGLVGWLLLQAPAREEGERRRHREAVDAWLRELVPAESLMAYVERASDIALTVLPLRTPVPLPDPGASAERRREAVDALLAAYDHARAQALLGKFGLVGHGRGPHLVARAHVVRGADAGQLLLDMSGVSDRALTDWLQHFQWLAAQERGWGPLALRRLGLHLRNVMAATTNAVPLVFHALTGDVFVLGPN